MVGSVYYSRLHSICDTHHMILFQFLHNRRFLDRPHRCHRTAEEYQEFLVEHHLQASFAVVPYRFLYCRNIFCCSPSTKAMLLTLPACERGIWCVELLVSTIQLQ